MARVYTDRQGKVVIKVFEPTEKPIFEFDEDNIFDKDQPLAWEQAINHVEVKTTQMEPGQIQNILQDLEEFSIPAGEEVKRTYTFTATPAIDIQEPEIEADNDVSVKDYKAYAWDRYVAS